MTHCPNCGKELTDEVSFCDECGTAVLPVASSVFCGECGAENTAGSRFCQKCGAQLSDAPVPESATEPAPVKLPELKLPEVKLPDLKLPGKKLPGKKLLIGGIAVAAVIALILLIPLLFGGSSWESSVMYLKGGELYLSDLSDEEPVEITSKLMDEFDLSDYYDYYEGYLAEITFEAADLVSSFTSWNEDRDRLFFPDRLDMDSDGLTLYWRDPGKPDEPAAKIDSDITRYAHNKEGDQVLYLKGSNSALYLHDLEEKEKIASDVAAFYTIEDLSKILYLTHDGELYLWSKGQEKTKITSDVTELSHVSQDLSTAFYLKSDALYKYTAGSEDPEKIDSDIYDLITVCSTNEAYYIKAETSNLALIDFVQDDLADSDALLTEPTYPEYPDEPDYPYWWEYDTDEEYNAAAEAYNAAYETYTAECDRLYEEYVNAYYAYQDKESRDYLREALRGSTTDYTNYSLYYYNGKETALVLDNMIYGYATSMAEDGAALTTNVCSISELGKFNLSEIESAYDVELLLESEILDSTEKALVVKGAALDTGYTDATSFYFSEDGSTVLFLDGISDDYTGDLYKCSVKNGALTTPELVDSDVRSYPVTILGNGDIAYFKNFNDADSTGDLFLNGVEIDYDVAVYSGFNSALTQHGDSLLYYTDWDSEDARGTLVQFNGKEKQTISDDVTLHTITESGDILYLYDYSTEHCSGSLYRFSDGEAQKIEDEIDMLIIPSEKLIKGFY